MCCHGHVFVFKGMGRLKGRGRVSEGEPAKSNPSFQTRKCVPFGTHFRVWKEGLDLAGSPSLTLPLPFNLPIPLNTKTWPWQHIFTFKRDPNQLPSSHNVSFLFSPLPSLAL